MNLELLVEQNARGWENNLVGGMRCLELLMAAFLGSVQSAFRMADAMLMVAENWGPWPSWVIDHKPTIASRPNPVSGIFELLPIHALLTNPPLIAFLSTPLPFNHLSLTSILLLSTFGGSIAFSFSNTRTLTGPRMISFTGFKAASWRLSFRARVDWWGGWGVGGGVE